jgi:hypothetical protein
MTQSRNPDNLIRAWLDLMPDKAPERVVDIVLVATGTTPQMRPTIASAAWRSSRMYRFASLAAAGLLGAAIVGGAMLLAGNPRTPIKPTDPALTQAPTQIPAKTEAAFPEALYATWTTTVDRILGIENGGGPIQLVISAIGTPNAHVENLQPGARFGSVLNAIGADQLRMVVERADSYCLDVGAEGAYRWSMSADRSQMTLTPVSDACSHRSAALGRSWVRTLTKPTSIGAGIVDAFQPFFTVTLPDGSFDSRALTDYIAIERSDQLSLSAWKNPQGFANPCDQAERVAYAPGIDAFVSYFEQNPAFSIVENRPLKIDSHDAVHLVVEGRDFAACSGQSLLLFTPKDCDCYWVSDPGFRDSFYAVEVGTDTIVIEFATGNSSEPEAPVIDSIRLPASYPGP